VSDIKAPTRESKKVEPMKFVRVLAEVDRSKSITWPKYRTMLTMFATKPMFSSDVKVVRTYEGKKGKQLSWDIVDISHIHTYIYLDIKACTEGGNIVTENERGSSESTFSFAHDCHWAVRFVACFGILLSLDICTIYEICQQYINYENRSVRGRGGMRRLHLPYWRLNLKGMKQRPA
jgi:hypothetical protein